MRMYRIGDIALPEGVSIPEVWNAVHKLGLEPDRRGPRREPFFREDHFALILRVVVLEKHAANLENANKDLESFSHSASHDLRTPLRLMNKVAHQLLEDHRDQLSGDAIHKAEMILTSTHEMVALVEDLLDLSRVSREPMKKRRVDMARLAREAVEELRDAREGRDVEVAIKNLASCQADRTLLKQVIRNLLENALKFTRPRKRAEIQMGCAETHGETVFFVRDNGVGFDPSAADNLFLAFHRLHKRDEFEGTGIGLALVRRIVERHGGRIWAEGEIDKGATFYFTLGGGTPNDPFDPPARRLHSKLLPKLYPAVYHNFVFKG